MENALTALAAIAAPQAAVTKTDDSSMAEKLAKKRKLLRAFESNKQREQTEAQKARRYYHHKQWTDAQIRVLEARKQPVITANRIQRKIDFIVGVEQRMRRDPKGYARTPLHTQAADVATAGLRYCCDVNRWEQIASDSAHDGMVSGIGVVWVGGEAGRDGIDPKIKLGQVERFFYDPRSAKFDFSDARYLGVTIWIDLEEAKERWPDSEDRLEEAVDRANHLANLPVDRDRAEQWADFENKRVRVVEIWEKKRGAWEFCMFTGDVYLEGGPSPYHDEDGKPDCPYVAWSPYVDEKGDRYGLVRSMFSIQDEINHRRGKLLHMLNVRQTFGKTGVVEDVDRTKAEMARADGHVEIHGEWGVDFGIVDQSQQIQGQAELLAEAKAEIENIGANPGLTGKGQGVDGASGRALLTQRDSGMTELSPVLDRLRDWKLRVYRKLWARMRHFWTGEKWIRITDEDDAPRFMGVNIVDDGAGDFRIGSVMTDEGGQPQNFIQGQIAAIDVDIILEEGPDTITMTEELLQALSQLGPGAVPPEMLIELSNAPNKEKLLKQLEKAKAPPPDMMAMQQRMAHLEEVLKAADIDVKRSTVEKNRADTFVTLAGVGANSQMAGQSFPMQFGTPLLEEEAMLSGGMQQDQGPQVPGGMASAAPPNIGPTDPEAMTPQTPDHGAVMLQAGAPGGLPIDPNLSA